LVIITVVLIIGYNIWNNSKKPEVFSETYSSYGLKFRYPEGMSYSEENFGDKPVSHDSGFFQGFLSDDPCFTYIQVFWNSSDVYDGPGDFVDSFLMRVENSPDDVTGIGSLQFDSKDGFSFVYRCFNVTDRGGFSYRGVIGSWRDNEVERFYMVAYLTSGTVDVVELVGLFNTLVESVENV
jgi:hypothetical protein